jgi:hypothetical protein
MKVRLLRSVQRGSKRRRRRKRGRRRNGQRKPRKVAKLRRLKLKARKKKTATESTWRIIDHCVHYSFSMCHCIIGVGLRRRRLGLGFKKLVLP